MGLKQQTSRQALTANRITATVAATKPVKIGSSYVLDFSDRPKRRFIEQRHISLNQRQAFVCILLTLAFLYMQYLKFELNTICSMHSRSASASKSYTRFKNCGINSTTRSIILECCTNVTMGPLYLSQIKCTLVGMHLGLQHKSKPLTPIRSGTQQHYLSPQGGILWYKCHTTTIFLQNNKKYSLQPLYFYPKRILYYSKAIDQPET